MQLPRRTLLTAAAAAPIARLPLAPLAAHAETTAATIVSDWDVPGGHFYTQTAPRDAVTDAGFLVSDGDGLTFWRDYKALGGPTQLGFPVSGRWESEGETFQATEAALLHWDGGAARVYPVFKLFTQYGLDDWLEGQGVPAASPELLANPDLPVWTRQGWLTNPTLRAAYWAAFEIDGPRRYGLPMSEPIRMGPYLAQRFERAVLQLWLDDVPGMPEPGSIVLVQVADLLRRAEMIPAGALSPQAAPAPRPDPARVVPAPAGATPVSSVAGQHIVVSLGRQWFFAYEDGGLVMNGPVTTGRPELVTPLGSFRVMSRHAPYTFVSPWAPGSPFWYETSVSNYALLITSNGVFLHDAPWRPYNGPGTNVPHVDPDGVWRTGSHGCINMRTADAAWAYRWAVVGTPVDVIA
jgi:lipoprotein-anchoring transpeptidase ErfK/SrfK